MFKKIFIFITFLFIFTNLLSCTDKVTYSGKIIDNNIDTKLIQTKNELKITRLTKHHPYEPSHQDSNNS